MFCYSFIVYFLGTGNMKFLNDNIVKYIILGVRSFYKYCQTFLFVFLLLGTAAEAKTEPETKTESKEFKYPVR